MELWYEVATPTKEIRDARSFDLDRLAIGILEVEQAPKLVSPRLANAMSVPQPKGRKAGFQRDAMLLEVPR